MTQLEKLEAAAKALSEPQIEALIGFARSMQGKAYFDTAPPEAIASIERGLAQIDAGLTLSLDELSARMKRSAQSNQE